MALWLVSWPYPGLPGGIGHDLQIFFPLYVPELLPPPCPPALGFAVFHGFRWWWSSLRCGFIWLAISSLFLLSQYLNFLPLFILHVLDCLLWLPFCSLWRLPCQGSWVDFSALQWLAIRQSWHWTWGCGKLLSPILWFSCIVGICYRECVCPSQTPHFFQLHLFASFSSLTKGIALPIATKRTGGWCFPFVSH